MNKTLRMRGGLVALLGVLGCLLAVGAAPAMATPHFSDTAHGMKVSGSIQFSGEGKLETVTCTMPTTQSSYLLESLAEVWTSTNSWQGINLTCGKSNAEMGFVIKALSTSSVEVFSPSPGHSWTSPWGSSYVQSNAVADFTNGSGTTSSTLTFSNDKVGSIPSTSYVYADGTLKVTTSSGGLLTILP